MFRGNHPARSTKRAGLKIPAAFKEHMDAQGVTQFFITSTDGKRAEVWPLPEWEKVEDSLPGQHHGRRGGEVLEPDQLLRSAGGDGQPGPGPAAADSALQARLDSEVAVMGKTTYLEVHNREIFGEYLPANGMTAERSQGSGQRFDRRSDRPEPPRGAHDDSRKNAMCRFF